MEYSEFTGDAEALLQPPYGLVILPSPDLDYVSDEWIPWIKENRTYCCAVNFVFLSKRLRYGNAVPGQLAVIDHPKFLLKYMTKPDEARRYYESAALDGICIWGGYDYWFRDYRIVQKRTVTDKNEQLPLWCGPEQAGPDKGGNFHFAGQYSSCSACNILARILGWACTILVLGNKGQGGFCDLVVNLKPEAKKRTDDKYKKSHPKADNLQWWYLRSKALETKTEIIHIGGPAVSVPRISERAALEAVNGAYVGTDN